VKINAAIRHDGLLLSHLLQDEFVCEIFGAKNQAQTIVYLFFVRIFGCAGLICILNDSNLFFCVGFIIVFYAFT